MNPEKIGRYEIKAELGRGGMATVFQAHDPRFKRDVAIKVLPAAFTHDATFRARFEREAQTIAALEYPGIVPVYDFGEENDQPYLVMRYMTGGSLQQKLKDGPQSISETSQIFTRLAAALDYVHSKGIIHRDLKPANILFDQHGNAYISDFGIARIAEASVALTGDGLIGTPSYMSPEQARGDSDIDGRSDIYALGAILFEMLTGKTPYEATTPMGVAMKHLIDPVPRILQVKADLPAECEGLIASAMAKDRNQRFSNAAEMAKALAEISSRAETRQPAGAKAPAAWPPAPPPTPIPVPSQAQAPVSPQTARPLTPPPPAAQVVYRQGTPPPPAAQSARPLIPPPPSAPAARFQNTPPPPARRTRKPLGVWAWLGISALAMFVITGCLFGGAWLGLFGLGALLESVPATTPVIDPGPKPTLPTNPEPTAHLVAQGSPVPTLGVSAFRDDFSDTSSGWYTYSGTEGLADYSNGYFRIFVDVPNTFLYTNANRYYENLIIETQVSKVGGPDDNYLGVLCRFLDESNFYYLMISSDGYYAIGKMFNGANALIGMDNWQYNDFIRRGQTTNNLRADCVGEELTLYANGVRLARVQDDTFAGGDVGLIAGTPGSTQGTDILFDNLIITFP